jgi:hypothetical protein
MERKMMGAIYYDVYVSVPVDCTELISLLIKASDRGDGLFKQFANQDDLDPSMYEYKSCEKVNERYEFKTLFHSDVLSLPFVSSILDRIEELSEGYDLQLTARSVWDDGYVADYDKNGYWRVSSCSLLDK